MEIHPTVLGVLGNGRTLDQDIFETQYVRWDEKGGTYAAPDATLVNTTTFERTHALSEVISAILGTGLSIELFHESHTPMRRGRGRSRAMTAFTVCPKDGRNTH